MTYVVLARRYRPQSFVEVYAQDHITRTLCNAIEMDRIAHAYLFTGPRGVGKTSLARIMAKSLNCVEGPTKTPCNVCENCVEITNGVSSDVIEIDGASNTGVDDIRELQKELMYSTSKSKYKIYIIDEVHMLSKSAFNALLKTLEEPPENVIFIFATTEPHKILPTIISRCQRYDFKRIPIDEIVKRLKTICESENISIDEEAMFVIAKKADGGMRDALSLMDQVISYGKEHISVDDVLSIFGILRTDVYTEILKSIKNKQSTAMIKILHDILERGNDLQEFIGGLLDCLRNLLMLKVGVDVPELPTKMKNEFKQLSADFTEDDILYMMSYLVKTKTDVKLSDNPVLVAEMSFIKLARIAELSSIDTLIEKVSNVKYVDAPQKESYSKVQEEILHITSDKVKENMAMEVEEERPSIEKLTEELIAKEWSNITAKIQKVKPLLYSYVNNTKIAKVSGNSITLTVTSTLGRDDINKNKELLIDIISKHFRMKRIALHVNYVKPEQKQIKKNPTLQDIQKELPELAEFIEKTDCIITRR